MPQCKGEKMNDNFAQYAFLVTVCTNEDDVVNNFGYKREEKFLENVTRKIMIALAEYPGLTSIDISPVDMSSVLNTEDRETADEEVDDE